MGDVAPGSRFWHFGQMFHQRPHPAPAKPESSPQVRAGWQALQLMTRRCDCPAVSLYQVDALSLRAASIAAIVSMDGIEDPVRHLCIVGMDTSIRGASFLSEPEGRPHFSHHLSKSTGMGMDENFFLRNSMFGNSLVSNCLAFSSRPVGILLVLPYS